MMNFDSLVAENYSNIVKSYLEQCKKKGKIDFLYSFETVMKDYKGIPVAKLIVRDDSVQLLPIGEEQRDS